MHEEDISIEFNQIIKEYIEDLVSTYCIGTNADWDMEGLHSEILNTMGIDFQSQKDEINNQGLIDEIIEASKNIIEFKKENFDQELFNGFQKFVILRTIDEKWQDHLYAMDQLREGIGLRAYGQKNPLIEYKQEGFGMFETMMMDTNTETIKRIFRTDLRNLGQSNMKAEQKTSNLKTSQNVNVLSAMNRNKVSEESQNTGQSFLNPSPKIPEKKQPIKVDKKVGRNEPCPCGSGLKYKKCHG